MSNQLLKGKKGIIFGALDEKSIAWKTALACHAQGAEIVLSNAPIALRMGEINKLSEQINAPVIGADVTNMDDLKNLFTESMKHFGGGIDFILHSIGMSINLRKGKGYTEIDYGFNQKTFDISAMSLHRVLRTAWDMDALNEWGSVVALSYIAAQRVFPDYNEMADAKAATLDADLFISIGSSLQVFPAAGFPVLASQNRTPADQRGALGGGGLAPRGRRDLWRGVAHRHA